MINSVCVNEQQAPASQVFLRFHSEALQVGIMNLPINHEMI